MAEWADLPFDALVLIAKHIEFFEDYLNFYEVCKSWHSVTSVLGKFLPLPSRFPLVMLTDKAEINFPETTDDLRPGDMLAREAPKNEQIEGMHKRQFFSFSDSKVYDFELPEATRKRCLGVGYGLLLTIGFDLQINILNPFTRQQIGLPGMLSFKTNHKYNAKSPQTCVHVFVRKVAVSSNPYSNRGEDCIIMAIYGEHQILGFARPGDKVWTDIRSARNKMSYDDVVFYNGKFYAVNWQGFVDVCDINDGTATHIARGPDPYNYNHKYLVESSGDLLMVIRYRKGPFYGDEDDVDQPYNYTVGFSIFKLEVSESESECDFPYKFTQVKNLGNNALFIGNNPSVSLPCSRCVKANSIYFSDNDAEAKSALPYGGGHDTGIYDVETGNITLHYASNFMSHLTPPMWIIT